MLSGFLLASLTAEPDLQILSSYQELEERVFFNDDLVFQLAYGAGGIEVLGADDLAVEDRMTAKDSGIGGHHGKPLVVGSIPGIIDKSQSLQKRMRPQIIGITVDHRA